MPSAHQIGIEAEERPIRAVHGRFLLFQAKFQVVTMRNTVTVSNNERRAIIRFSFQERSDRLRIIGTKSDPRHIDVAIS